MTIAVRALFALAVVVGSACGAPVENVDLGDAFALEESCGEACTEESELVGQRLTLDGHHHSVVGDLVIVNDSTVAVEGFGFDGGGLDVRAVLGDTIDAIGDGDYVVLSEDLRRAGGYENARLEFALPDDLTVDEFGAFSIWCIPASANLAHVEL